MHLVQIPPHAIAKLWPLAAPMLARAIDYTGGAASLGSELAAVCAEKKQLWMVVDPDGAVQNQAVAAGVTSLQVNADGSKTANIELFGGDNMKAWFALKDRFEDWARGEGCRDVRLWARKGWAKHLPDFKLTHYILRKTLA
jgi:hypothetical protein